MTPREAAIALNLIPGLGPVRIMRLLQVFASPELILESPSSLLMEIPGVGAQLACRISSWRSIVNPYRELELADNAGAAVTTVFDDSYPSSLRALPDPPIVLYSWGNWTGTDAERSIAVVGSRMATHYGRLCARNISHDLAEAGITVISGLARGVDTEAHTGAMDAEGRTIAVIGAGLNKLYPRENRNLAQRIADGHGAVVSEFPMDLPPSRTTFPMRNRIVSGWSRATLVVEASGRSGALITARTAAEQGRDVFCIPGPAFFRRMPCPHPGRSHPSYRSLRYSAGHELGRSGTGTASLLAMLPCRSLNPTASHFGRKGDSPRHQTGFQYY